MRAFTAERCREDQCVAKGRQPVALSALEKGPSRRVGGLKSMTRDRKRVDACDPAHFVGAMEAGCGSPRKKDWPFQATREDPSIRAQQKGVVTIVVICSYHIPTFDGSNQLARKRVIGRVS